MIVTTRAQREALFRIFLRDFPSWLTPTIRLQEQDRRHFEGHPYDAEKFADFAVRNPHRVVKVPSIQYRNFRKTVHGGYGCIMIHRWGMWLGIEPDGYTHS
ncbi:hypothetical protein [Bradyrhizobium erythrophlei]|uniref:Uncharacterized protein n=1 Tax=Bradyrhizobium erythrophlei TaxID=1437360 RepID=A0A1M5NJG3_9BRAD|nr:hypothetical protein [Bradyrhizobium erythrophlei]SHG89083.1 hypothetical protein SAMN05443248_3002 [Bradyrhizobium erythrophlei]